MNLNDLSDDKLISDTDKLVGNEREILVVILRHFREIERRRLFSTLGYESLHELAVHKFKYSGDQAQRRVSAMHLMRDLPEIEEKVSTGEINLTHMGLAHSLFQQEKKNQNQAMTHAEKLDVIEQISNTTTREAERITLSMSSNPEAAKPDRVRQVTEDLIEMKFMARNRLQDQIEELKGRLAHKAPGIGLGELFEALCDLGLKEWDPSKPTKRSGPKFRSRKSKTESSASEKAETDGALSARTDAEQAVTKRKTRGKSQSAPASSHAVRNSDKTAAPRLNVKDVAPIECRHVNEKLDANANEDVKATAAKDQSVKHPTRKLSQAAIRRMVFARAQNRCEICESTYALQPDHIIPRAKGGSDDLENQRLLCRSCNQRMAIIEFGQATMDLFI